VLYKYSKKISIWQGKNKIILQKRLLHQKKSHI